MGAVDVVLAVEAIALFLGGAGGQGWASSRIGGRHMWPVVAFRFVFVVGGSDTEVTQVVVVVALFFADLSVCVLLPVPNITIDSKK